MRQRATSGALRGYHDQRAAQRAGRLDDRPHDLLVAVPKPDRDRPLGGSGQRLEKLDETAVLEGQGGGAPTLVLAEKAQLRGAQRVAGQLDVEGGGEGEQVMERLVASIGDDRPGPLKRRLTFPDKGEWELREAVREVDLLEDGEPEDQRLEVTDTDHQPKERASPVREVVGDAEQLVVDVVIVGSLAMLDERRGERVRLPLHPLQHIG